MKTKLFLLSVIVFCLSICSINAQTGKTKSKVTDTKETKVEPSKTKDSGAALKEELNKSRAYFKTTYTPHIKSKYNDQEKLILSYLNINYIPNTFPKYDDTMSDKQYEDNMKKWASENKSYLKEEFKNQF